ncbi:SMC family ATPase [Neobacillus sp. PS3-12]|uniref:SMC family ATPase n=1 Tax=Neobacillus sp. PS3-12 TaxID=3070677 RepID=UPI0027DFC8B7|nr:SMC family ATPase [Neobacillus sp. PS3-12]WML53135.1 SMC family ATPase [Neobacillus sp. PS3-12]
MRPLKITMTAFGPYKHSEVIDFTELKNNRLFVISGNTGAGKTTIFDAICFALYGSASGEDRSETKYLRSDFADDDVHTAIELEFELHNRFYRIKRQLPHVKIGNKSATGEQYEFYEKVNGREIPCVDRQIVSEINKKVEELVGLTKDQFSQIVMLPQGEFRKLLTSQTENKEEILRKIFRTEPYRWISDRLKEKKKFAEEEFKRESATRDRYISDIQAALPLREESNLFEFLSQENYNTNQIISGLEEEILYFQDEVGRNKQNEETSGAAYNKKLEEFHKAEQVNEEFKKLEDKQKNLEELTAQLPLFKEKEIQLENAERASKIEPYEKQVNEWREDEKNKKQRLDFAVAEQKNAVSTLEKVQRNFELEESKKEEREKIARQLDRYHDFLPTVKDMDNKKAELTRQEQQVQNLGKVLDVLKTKIKTEKDSKVQLGRSIKELEKAVDQLAEKQQKLTDMRDRIRVLHEYLGIYKNQVELQNLFKTKEESFQAIKQKYEKLEEAWVNGQASILAIHLHDGKPCPVCGSTEHPNKAQGQDAVPTREELDLVKKELELKDSEYRDLVAQLKNGKDQFEQKAKEVAEIGVQVQEVQPEYKRLAEEGQALKKDVERLGKEKEKLSKLKNDLETKEKQLEGFEAEQEAAAKAYQEQNTVYESKKAVYVEQVNRIPEEIRTLAELNRKITEINNLKNKLENAWEQAQKQLQLAKETVAKASVNVSGMKEQLEESSLKKENSEQQFLGALLQANFSAEDDYRNAKMLENARITLKEEIDQFKNNLATLKQQVLEYQDDLKDKTKIDLPELKSELDELNSAYEEAKKLLLKSEQNQQKANELKHTIIKAEKSTVELEKRLNIVADLYDVIRGQNSSKISFERYLQIEYLEQIIITANERLKRLSNGQFLLIRSERQESRGKQSGLGLDVFDAYTGQTRDVKTLSGGEKFNASLCLALGMADVIQSFQGGVSIDTMFIDEGFGSLDEESLNKAVDTLIDLQQSGRMIGVISHVQELKNTIPAILEVKKTKEGYSQTKFVIK